MRHKANRNLLLAYPADMPFAGACLSEAYNQLHIRCVCVPYSGRPPEEQFYSALLTKNINAVLVAGKKSYAPSTVLPGPFLFTKNAGKIPAAWLPVQNENDVLAFVRTLKKVHQRKHAAPGMALLAQWHPRYLKLSDRMSELLKAPVKVFRWTGDIITRENVVEALGTGLGMGIYFGHGRPVGWVGYYGMRSHHFKDFSGKPMGCILSLCCRTASRRRTGISYAESLPLMGVSAAAFGAVRETKHTDNMRWAVRICSALNNGIDNLADLLLYSELPDIDAVQHYRIIGDPFAPLYSDADSIQKAGAVTVFN